MADFFIKFSGYRASRQIVGLGLGLLIVRGIVAAVIPLMDDTESRYAEIARMMVETQRWITPQFDYDVPFWGKPPLAFWLAATGISLFGPGEFGPRFPFLVLSVGFVVLFWRFVKENSGSPTAHVATVMLGSSAIFLISAGAVMTDMTLLFCLLLMLTGFWGIIKYKRTRDGYIFFSGMALGVLTKGLVVFVIGGLPIAVWLTWTKNWRLLAHLPWLKGLCLFSLIAVPWYVIAEIKTPGFLEYFFVGEHIKRYLFAGWQGDLYGYTHAQPRGMIWVFCLLGLAPWSLVVPLLAWTRRGHLSNLLLEYNSNEVYFRYLLCWALVPCLFLTFARNIIWSYSLLIAPAACILFATFLITTSDQEKRARSSLKTVLGLGGAIPLLGFLIMMALHNQLEMNSNFTHKKVI